MGKNALQETFFFLEKKASGKKKALQKPFFGC
jgi:hypothetical protein